MKFPLSIFAAICFALVVATPAGASRPLVSAQIMAKTTRVHNCEEPVWNVRGSIYAGGLGWRLALWPEFKAPSFPRSMADATPEQQAWAMAHFVAKTLHYWPDQHGCTGGY